MKQEFAKKLINTIAEIFKLNHNNSFITTHICKENGGKAFDNSVEMRCISDEYDLLTYDVINTIESMYRNKRLTVDEQVRGCGNSIIVKTSDNSFIVAQDYIDVRLKLKKNDVI